jgi:hypothetical protein
MTHAGTMDLGGSAQSKQSGSPWAAIALTVAVVVAIVERRPPGWHGGEAGR